MEPQATFPLHSGGAMPVLGLGTWQLTRETAATVAEALQLGYRMIDTSGDYGTQPGVSEGIRRSGVPRGEIFLVTKVEEDEDGYAAAQRNLRELELEQVDLLLIHRPPPGGAGRELWEALIRAKEDGLARDIGVSNYTVEQVEELAEATGELPVVNQIEWSPFGWSRELLAHGRERGIVLQAYSPLTRTRRLGDERLAELAAEYDRTPAQVLLRWCLQLGVAPLPKATRREHLEENLAVFDFELSETHLRELGGLDERYSSLGPSLAYE